MSITTKQIDTVSIIDIDYGMPARISIWRESASGIFNNKNTTQFGYVLKGVSFITMSDGRKYPLIAGMYFSIPDEFTIDGGAGVVFSKFQYRGIFSIGGPLQEDSTLKYLPGCVDSILIPPVFRGDPCLNFLNTTKGTLQPVHTHPSYRLGIVISGQGWEVSQAPLIKSELREGSIFVVAPWQEHAFETTNKDLKFIVFHPNSDYGPTRNDHPLINQTFVNGERFFVRE